MSKNYYFTTANHFSGDTLYVPYKDKLYKNFGCISYLDDATIRMGEYFDEIMKEVNPKAYRDDFKYISELGSDGFIKPQASFRETMINMNGDERAKELLNRFMYFVEQRNYIYEKDVTNYLIYSSEFNNFILYLLKIICSFDTKTFYELINVYSCVPDQIKALLQIKKMACNDISAEEFYRKYQFQFNVVLSNYQKLRHLVIALANILINNPIDYKISFDEVEYAYIRNLEEKEPVPLSCDMNKVISAKNSRYHQYTLDEYFKGAM